MKTPEGLGLAIVGAGPRRCRLTAAISAALLLATVLAALVAIVSQSAGSTLLTRAAYDKALADTDAYNRLYTQVLPDPQTGDVVDSLLAQLPVDRSLITANLRLVLPTSTLRGLVDEALTQALDYLRGEGQELNLRLDLTPVLSNVAQLANTYLGNGLAAAPEVNAGNIAALTRKLLAAASEISEGRTPSEIPDLPLSAAQTRQVSAALLAGLPSAPARALEPQLQVLIAEGDFAGALSLLIPVSFPGVGQAVNHLSERLTDGHLLSVNLSSDSVKDPTAQDLLGVLHDIGGQTAWLTAGAALIALGCLFSAVRVARSRHLTGIGLVLSGGTALVVGVVGETFVADPLQSLTSASSPLAPQGRRLLADIAGDLRSQFSRRYLLLAAALLVSGLVLTAAPVVTRLFKQARRRRLVGFATASLAPLLLIVSAAFAVPVTNATGLRTCNGFSQLCDRPYDKVVYAATHNSMADSEDQFLGPSQDPSIVHQLDNGVRALLIDTHYWTPAAKVAAYLQSLPAASRASLRPFAEPVTRSRRGTWLCHDVCQLGATPLTAQLKEIHQWLQQNPDEVVTLIIQDGISVSDTQRAMKESGLGADVAVPPPNPEAAWPTLRELIDSGKRAYVFAEQSDVPGSWYRNFYRYASDTPFRNQSTAKLACQLNRGSPGAPLLLLNNWVTRTASSRHAAAQANSADFLLHQAQLCLRERGRKPNFLAVDFAETGQLLSAVNQLNGVSTRS